MSAKDIDILLRNNTGNKDKSTLIDGFVVRTKIFDTIYKELMSIRLDTSLQNYLIIGQRGSGKTTLLYRLKYAIEDTPKMNIQLVPIILSEEQYNLTELENLWENVGDQLEEIAEFKGVSQEMASLINEEYYEEKAFEKIEQHAKKAKKKVVVLLENIDTLFKKIGNDGQKRLREVLISSKCFSIIASSTSYFEDITDDTKPFYDFFKVIELNGLTSQECITLLLKIGEQFDKKDKIEAIIKKNPKRIESLRRLTGGNPRTISYLFQIFLDNENGKALRDLYQLVDTLTFLYKAELDQLSAQQQKVVDVIARNWDAIAVKDISIRSRYESKQISSILNVLEKNQFIEVVSTKSKNNLYRIRERFLNIWYLMRFGKKQEKENIVWLVKFYDTWCDKTELAKQLNIHLKNLTDGKYDINAAIDMGNMFLACENVSTELKFDLYKKTKSLIPKQFIKELKISDELLYDSIKSLVKEKNYDQAIEILKETENRDEKYYNLIGWLYLEKKQYLESLEALKQVYVFNPSGETAFRLARMYQSRIKDVPQAISYYEEAIEKKEWIAASSLGDLYFSEGNIEKANFFHQLALENGVKSSFLSLARMALYRNDMALAEEYSLNAIESGLAEGHNLYGIILQGKSQYKKAEDAFERAVAGGYKPALLQLGVLNILRRKVNFEKSVQFFTEAINAGFDEGYYLLGELYLYELRDETEGLKNMEIAITKGNGRAAHKLGHYFQNKGDYINSDNYFLKAYELGQKSALLCLTHSFFIEKRKDKKNAAVKVLQDHLEELEAEIPFSSIDYAFALLWDDQVEKSLELFTNNFKDLKAAFEQRDNGSESDYALRDIVNYLNLLIAKGLYNVALQLFSQTEELDLKKIARPVYYALMNYMKEEFPKEYLKAGAELKDTIKEIMDVIEKYRKEYL